MITSFTVRCPFKQSYRGLTLLVSILSLIVFTGVDAFSQNRRADSLSRIFELQSMQQGNTGTESLSQLFFARQDVDAAKTTEWVTREIDRHVQDGNRPMEGWFRVFHSILKHRSGDNLASRNELKTALRIAGAFKLTHLLGMCQMQLGNIHRAEGNYDSAKYQYHIAEKAFDTKHPFFLFLLHAQRIVFFNFWHQPDSAVIHLRKLESIVSLPPLRYLQFYTQYMAGETALNKSNLPKAKQLIEGLLRAAPTTSLPYLLGIKAQAELSFRNGDFPKMTAYYAQLLSNDNPFHLISHVDLANLFFNLAEAFDSQGQHDLAMEYVTKALTMAIQNNYRNLQGRCYLERAWINYATDNLVTSKADLDRADELFQITKDEYNKTSVLNLRATLKTRENQPNQALELHQACLNQRTRLGDPYLISSSLYNIGTLLNETKQFAKALPILLRGISIDRASGDIYGIGLYSNELAVTHRGLNQTDSALTYLDQAIRTAGPEGSAEILLASYQLRSEIQEQTGNKSAALSDMREYTRVQQRVMTTESRQNLAVYQTLFDLANKEQQINLLNKEATLQQELVINQRKFLYLLFGGVLIAVVVALTYILLSKKLSRLSRSNEERAAILDERNLQLEKTMEDLRRAQDHLLVSEKMASLGILSLGVAHELNNPLNFIHGGVEGLKSELTKAGPDPSVVQRLLEAIEEGVRRSNRIIHGLRHYSHSSEKNDEACDVHHILENCLIILENKTKNRITILREYASVPPILTGNAGRLHQALLNILANAEQAIQGEGIITLRTENIGNRISIEIGDTGCGIPEENLKRLGDLFFTTKKPGEGTGFGLSLAYRVFDEMGGIIKVASTIGNGTTFTISFQQ